MSLNLKVIQHSTHINIKPVHKCIESSTAMPNEPHT